MNPSFAGDEIDSFEFEKADHPAKVLDLIDLQVWPPRQGERGKCFPIWPELRIAEETIVTDDWRITVHLTRAEIAAEFKGCHIAPGSRYGEVLLPPSVEVKETELDVKDYTSLGEEPKSKITQYRIKTRPNDRWEVVEPNRRLRGTYLVVPADEETSAKPLCRVIATSETIAISLSVEVRPHDLDPIITPRESSMWMLWSAGKKPNKIKIAKLLITKTCTDRFARPDDERVTLARVALRGKRLKCRLPDDSSE